MRAGDLEGALHRRPAPRADILADVTPAAPAAPDAGRQLRAFSASAHLAADAAERCVRETERLLSEQAAAVFATHPEVVGIGWHAPPLDPEEVTIVPMGTLAEGGGVLVASHGTGRLAPAHPAAAVVARLLRRLDPEACATIGAIDGPTVVVTREAVLVLRPDGSVALGTDAPNATWVSECLAREHARQRTHPDATP